MRTAVRYTSHDTEEGLPDEQLGETMHHPVMDELPKPRVSFMHCPACGSIHTNLEERLRCMEGQ